MDLTIEEQIAELRRIQPTILWAYPDCLQSMLQLLDGRLSQVIRPRKVITSAAVLPEGVRTRLREDLDCELYNSYACMETGRLAAECPAHQGMHVNADHVIVECEDEEWLNEQGRGVVIVTRAQRVSNAADPLSARRPDTYFGWILPLRLRVPENRGPGGSGGRRPGVAEWTEAGCLAVGCDHAWVRGTGSFSLPSACTRPARAPGGGAGLYGARGARTS